VVISFQRLEAGDTEGHSIEAGCEILSFAFTDVLNEIGQASGSLLMKVKTIFDLNFLKI